jgi:hypothetical protein
MSGPWQPADQAGWSTQQARSSSAFIRLGVVMAVVIVVAVVVVGGLAPASPPAPCPPVPAPCSVPPVPPGGVPETGSEQGGTNGAAELVDGPGWSSSAYGFSLHYDSSTWAVQENDKDLLQLISPSDSRGSQRDDWVIVEGVAASADTPQELVAARVASLAKSVPDLALSPDSYYQVNGPEIGDVAGIAAVYVGTLDDTDGTPVAPVRYSIVAASNGRVTVALTVRTLNPDGIADQGPPELTWHMYSRQLADVLLEDFRWPAP